MTSRKLRPLAAGAMITLIAAGCSNPPATTSSSNPPATTSTGSDGTNNTATNLAKGVKFAQCMRNNGVTDFPDPNASGQLTIDGIANGSSLDPTAPAFQQALSACKDLEPPGFTGTKRTAQQQEAALKFAQCMRNNGVNDFPDPTPDGPIINMSGVHSIPGFQAAQEKCSAIYAGAMGVGAQ